MYEDKLEKKTSKDFFFQICTLLSCKLENSWFTEICEIISLKKILTLTSVLQCYNNQLPKNFTFLSYFDSLWARWCVMMPHVKNKLHGISLIMMVGKFLTNSLLFIFHVPNTKHLAILNSKFIRGLPPRHDFVAGILKFYNFF